MAELLANTDIMRIYLGGEVQPGDLVFYSGDDHVGIVGGWDENGNVLIIHSASGYNNVVITGKMDFRTAARPLYYGLSTDQQYKN